MIRDSRGGHNRDIINKDFFKSWNPNMSYVLGFMYADGSLLNTNESSRTYYLLFSNNDLNLLREIRRALNSEHKIYVRLPHLMNYKNKKYICKTSYVLRIGNKEMYEDLIHLGLQHKKSNVMTLPDIPKPYFSYFIRGYLDGDGCINCSLNTGHNTPGLKALFTSGSKEFLNKLSAVISDYLNISSSVYKRGNAFNLVFHGSNAYMILKYIYSNIHAAPYLKYKYEKYLNFKNNLMGPRVKKELGII